MAIRRLFVFALALLALTNVQGQFNTTTVRTSATTSSSLSAASSSTLATPSVAVTGASGSSAQTTASNVRSVTTGASVSASTTASAVPVKAVQSFGNGNSAIVASAAFTSLTTYTAQIQSTSTPAMANPRVTPTSTPVTPTSTLVTPTTTVVCTQANVLNIVFVPICTTITSQVMAAAATVVSSVNTTSGSLSPSGNIGDSGNSGNSGNGSGNSTSEATVCMPSNWTCTNGYNNITQLFAPVCVSSDTRDKLMMAYQSTNTLGVTSLLANLQSSGKTLPLVPNLASITAVIFCSYKDSYRSYISRNLTLPSALPVVNAVNAAASSSALLQSVNGTTVNAAQSSAIISQVTTYASALNTSSITSTSSKSDKQAMRDAVSQLLQVVASTTATGNVSLDTAATLLASLTASRASLTKTAANVISDIMANVIANAQASNQVISAASASSMLTSVSVALGASNVADTSAVLPTTSTTIGNTLVQMSSLAAQSATIGSAAVVFSSSSGDIQVSAQKINVSGGVSLPSMGMGGMTLTDSTGALFNALSGFSTATIYASTSVTNPYNGIAPDNGNTTRTGLLQYGLFKPDGSQIPIANLASGFIMNFPTVNGLATPLFDGASVVPACQYWSNTYGNWTSDGCSVVSWNANSTTCSCNHLTSFSVSFQNLQVAPTLVIVPSSPHSTAIYIVIGVLAALWLASVLYSYVKLENHFGATQIRTNAMNMYVIEATTSREQRVGTSSVIYVQLHNADDSTDKQILSHGSTPGYVHKLVIRTADIGSVRAISVMHDGTGSSPTWKAEGIRVVNTNQGTVSEFGDSSTLSGSAGFPSETITASEVLLQDIGTLSKFVLRLSLAMPDRHLWLSTIGLPSGSAFTRTERIAVCWMIFFLNMALGTLWFQPANSNTPCDEVNIVQVVIVAIITSAISLAVVVPTGIILRRAGATVPKSVDADASASFLPATLPSGLRIATRIFVFIVTGGAAALSTLKLVDIDSFAASSSCAAPFGAIVEVVKALAISIAESLLFSQPTSVLLQCLWQAMTNKDPQRRRDTTGTMNEFGLKRTPSNGNKGKALLQSPTTMTAQRTVNLETTGYDTSMGLPDYNMGTHGIVHAEKRISAALSDSQSPGAPEANRARSLSRPQHFV